MHAPRRHVAGALVGAPPAVIIGILVLSRRHPATQSQHRESIQIHQIQTASRKTRTPLDCSSVPRENKTYLPFRTRVVLVVLTFVPPAFPLIMVVLVTL